MEPHDLNDPALRDRAVRAARGEAPFDVLLTGGRGRRRRHRRIARRRYRAGRPADRQRASAGHAPRCARTMLRLAGGSSRRG